MIHYVKRVAKQIHSVELEPYTLREILDLDKLIGRQVIQVQSYQAPFLRCLKIMEGTVQVSEISYHKLGLVDL